jgi:hypothetical protein
MPKKKRKKDNRKGKDILRKIFEFLRDNPNYIINPRLDARRFRMSRKDFSSVLKMAVNENFLVEIPTQDPKNPVLYFANISNYYSPKFLFESIPSHALREILSPLEMGEERSVSDLARNYFGDDKMGLDFILTLLEYLVSKGLLSRKLRSRKGILFKKTYLGLELSIDQQAVLTLEADNAELEKIITEQKKTGHQISSLSDAREIVSSELQRIIVPTISLPSLPPSDPVSLLFLSEVLIGNRNTDFDLLETAFHYYSSKGVNASIASGLIQGNFVGLNPDKTRLLVPSLDINSQFKIAGILIEELKKISGNVFVVLGSDDMELAKSYAYLAHAAEGGINFLGFLPNITYELKRRLDALRLQRKIKIQYESIIHYQYRIGRSLYNMGEVWEKIGIYKSEYRLIIEIITAIKRGIPYPSVYEAVVDVNVLREVLESLSNSYTGGFERKLYITPNSLFLKIHGKTIRIENNPLLFSRVTQYVNPAEILRKILGIYGSSKELPYMIFATGQEIFYTTFIPPGPKNNDGCWIVSLPGLQDSSLEVEGRIPKFSMVQSSRSHRQTTVRKIPASPGVLGVELSEDGRVCFEVLNKTAQRVIESSSGEEEVIHRIAFLTDIHFGSISMEPELVMRFCDYSLYQRKCDVLCVGGDIIQGVNYPATFVENSPHRLISIASQQRFVMETIFPLIVAAPNLQTILGVTGNHESNTFGVNITGNDPLNFLEMSIRNYVNAQKALGHAPIIKEVRFANRIRVKGVEPSVGGAIETFPFISGEFSGFRLAMTHRFQRFGYGSPTSQQISWLRNMATSAVNYDILVAGDKHSLWMGQVADKVLIHLPAAAHQTGYELSQGLRSTVMFVVLELSNKKPIRIEFIPRTFLEEQYKCASPMLVGKDDLLKLPKHGSKEFEEGRLSPFVEEIISRINKYDDE